MQNRYSDKKYDKGIKNQFALNEPTTPVKLQKQSDEHNPYSLPKLSPEAPRAINFTPMKIQE